MSSQVKSTGAIALVGGGLAASFALAACCALPVLLAGAGLSAYWLVPVASAAMPYANLLTALAVLTLAASVVLVIRAGRTCNPGDLCARPVFRWSIVAVAIIGAVLLVLSKIYA